MSLPNELRPKVTPRNNGVTVQTWVGTLEAGRFDFVVQQGATLSLGVTWLDESQAVVDVSGYSARMKIKTSWDASTTIDSLASGTEITLSASQPNIVIALTATETAAYDFTRACYDLELVNGATVTRLLEGFVTLRREVTA